MADARPYEAENGAEHAYHHPCEPESALKEQVMHVISILQVQLRNQTMRPMLRHPPRLTLQIPCNRRSRPELLDLSLLLILNRLVKIPPTLITVMQYVQHP